MGTFQKGDKFHPTVTNPRTLLEKRGWKIRQVNVEGKGMLQAEKNGHKVTRPCIRSLKNYCDVWDMVVETRKITGLHHIKVDKTSDSDGI
jgi:hypothetical protein